MLFASWHPYFLRDMSPSSLVYGRYNYPIQWFHKLVVDMEIYISITVHSYSIYYRLPVAITIVSMGFYNPINVSLGNPLKPWGCDPRCRVRSTKSPPWSVGNRSKAPRPPKPWSTWRWFFFGSVTGSGLMKLMKLCHVNIVNSYCKFSGSWKNQRFE